jgi:1-acyl-sn-glycerol-3-phosphate acyltransferase
VKLDGSVFYFLMRSFIGLALGFYFRRIERFHAERVPASGPVLIVANHPCSLTDSFVVGYSVERPVSFMATVQLFRFAPLRWLLTRCGVIPVNRLKDDPRGMKSVLETFERCYAVMERGGAVALFPEGITHDDLQLKEVKTGAARMALELSHRHDGKLDLRIVPVGLNFAAKENYRSDVFVNFGEPIRVNDYLAAYDTQRKDCIARLTAEIEVRIKSLIVHLPQLEHASLIAAIKRLYLARLRVGQNEINPLPGKADELALTRQIAEVVDSVHRHHPERAEDFKTSLAHYEKLLARLRIPDEVVEQGGRRRNLLWSSLGLSIVALLGLPVALYGWLHRLIPFAIVRWSVKRFAAPQKHKAQISTAAIFAGIVAFGGFYGACIVMAHALWGLPTSFWYGLSLPVASLVAFYYAREIRRLARGLRTLWILFRAPFAVRRLVAMRAELVNRVEAVHHALQRAEQISVSKP